jgi:hypothetical protein
VAPVLLLLGMASDVLAELSAGSLPVPTAFLSTAAAIRSALAGVLTTACTLILDDVAVGVELLLAGSPTG